MRQFLKKRWYFAVLFVVGLGLFLFQQQKPSVASDKTSTPYTVSKVALSDSLSLSGNIDAEEHVTLRFQTPGNLAWVGVKEGDTVKKYQAVASLDQRDLKKRMEKYLNTYKVSRWSYDQAQSDSKDENMGGLSDGAKDKLRRLADEAQFNLNNAVADVELQTLALQYATLTTPIDGVVTRVTSPYAGVNIIPTQAEFEVINPTSLYFSSTADQTDVVKVKEGMMGKITLDAYPDQTINGEVKSIAFTPKEGETGTVYEVKVEFNSDNDLNKYRLGMSGDVNFVMDNHSALAIPAKYILNEGDKKYVMKNVNGKKEKVYVQLGASESDGDLTEITSGLSEGDVIYD
jgi:RND family efflux transporter MFP subunit